MCQFLALERVDDLHNLQLATKKVCFVNTHIWWLTWLYWNTINYLGLLSICQSTVKKSFGMHCLFNL